MSPNTDRNSTDAYRILLLGIQEAIQVATSEGSTSDDIKAAAVKLIAFLRTLGDQRPRQPCLKILRLPERQLMLWEVKSA